jgi:Ca-activated chloride channel family protein
MVIPVIIAILICLNAQSFPTNWHKVIHPKLINYLLIGKTKKVNRWPLWLSSCCWLVACLALAGPAWNKTTINPHKSDYPLVIALDLSPGILAADLSPNRLSRVSYKLQDLLKARDQGSNALVVYSGSAHAVTPLTDDNRTLINLIQTLSPAVMPTIGNRADLAIDLAVNLLKQSGHTEADILLFTNEVSAAQQQKIKSILADTNIKLSVIGVGTEYGGPILLADASYLKDNNNNVKLFKLQHQQLSKLASENGGKYRTMTVDQKDLEAVLPKASAITKLNMQERNVDYWQDMGIWLVLLLLPFALFAFRWVCPVLLIALVLPVNDTYALEWQDLWKTKDQQAQEAFNKGDYAKASGLFKNPQWKAQASYAAGDYQQAAMASYEQTTAIDEFNRANALAKAGDLSNAIIAYDKSLELDPSLEDAQFNKAIVEKLLKQQNEQQQKQNQQSKDSKNKDSNKDSGQSQQQQAQQSQNDKQQGDNSEQQQQQQSQNDKQQGDNSQQQQSQQSQNDKQQGGNSEPQQQQQSQNDKQQGGNSEPQQSQQSQNDKQQGDNSEQSQGSKQNNQNANENQQGSQQQSAQGSEKNDQQDKQQAKGQAASDQAKDADKQQQQQAAGDKADEAKQQDKSQQLAKANNPDANQEQANTKHKSSVNNNKPENSPEQQAVESWLRTIPDNPGGLLKRKFMHQYKKHNGL